MSAPTTPERSANEVRLVPDGCDYLLRGVTRGAVDADVIPVRATAPGGTVVVAHVSRHAHGLTVDDGGTGSGEPAVLRLDNVAVSAAQVFPA